MDGLKAVPRSMLELYRLLDSFIYKDLLVGDQIDGGLGKDGSVHFRDREHVEMSGADLHGPSGSIDDMKLTGSHVIAPFKRLTVTKERLRRFLTRGGGLGIADLAVDCMEFNDGTPCTRLGGVGEGVEKLRGEETRGNDG